MKKIIVPDTCDLIFSTQKLPKVFIKLLIEELNKSENSYLLNYIKEQYNVSKEMLITKLISSVSTAKIKNSIVIFINNNNYVTQDIRIDSLISLLNDGNREIRGSNFYTKTVNYVMNNLVDLYRLYRWKRESNLWV